MKNWMRKLRGIVGMGAIWGALGAILGISGGLIGGFLDGGGMAEWVFTLGLGFGGFGVLMGSGFAATLTLLDGRKTLSELSIGRAAAWGGSAGFILPLALVASLSGGALPLLPALASAAVAGGVAALLGAGTVLVARRQGELAHRADESFLASPVSGDTPPLAPPHGEGSG